MAPLDPDALRVRPPSVPDPEDATLLKLLSLASGDVISGVTERGSTVGRFCDLIDPDESFFLLLSDALDAVLAFRVTPSSSISIVGVGLRDDVPDILPRRTLLLRVRLCSRSIAVCRGCGFSGSPRGV